LLLLLRHLLRDRRRLLLLLRPLLLRLQLVLLGHNQVPLAHGRQHLLLRPLLLLLLKLLLLKLLLPLLLLMLLLRIRQLRLLLLCTPLRLEVLRLHRLRMVLHLLLLVRLLLHRKLLSAARCLQQGLPSRRRCPHRPGRWRSKPRQPVLHLLHERPWALSQPVRGQSALLRRHRNAAPAGAVVAHSCSTAAFAAALVHNHQRPASALGADPAASAGMGCARAAGETPGGRF
jgi:hypothetical protein